MDGSPLSIHIEALVLFALFSLLSLTSVLTYCRHVAPVLTLSTERVTQRLQTHKLWNVEFRGSEKLVLDKENIFKEQRFWISLTIRSYRLC